MLTFYELFFIYYQQSKQSFNIKIPNVLLIKKCLHLFLAVIGYFYFFCLMSIVKISDVLYLCLIFMSEGQLFMSVSDFYVDVYNISGKFSFHIYIFVFCTFFSYMILKSFSNISFVLIVIKNCGKKVDPSRATKPK